ncbi:N-acetyl-gamma-glutamyl-phosphate reductase [hydrothermal vent metagenome]|uniref:N-acetyl-gamma-glutamyl-phosphate reductase n=1 Tax=hydrothermal vent metagenome TaxID=652676 RepID=A0A3B0YCW7_9ZZZZ
MKIFVDGSSGTVGLSIIGLIAHHPELELVHLDHSERKNALARKELMAVADLVVFCLPDKIVNESLKLVSDNQKLLDCSQLFRCDPHWVYGLPELNLGQRLLIAESQRVSNPGCFATAFILAARPLLSEAVLSNDTMLTAYAITGYSAGGKRMITQHEARAGQTVIHSLNLNHKHLPEMKMYSTLKRDPLLIPSVATHKEGLILSIPLPLLNDWSRSEVVEMYQKIYQDEKYIQVCEDHPNKLSAHYSSTNTVKVYVTGKPGCLMVIVKLNNLIKGAAGNAMQCINLMLGLNEWTGLN